jgi:hypothetical protein
MAVQERETPSITAFRSGGGGRDRRGTQVATLVLPMQGRVITTARPSADPMFSGSNPGGLL